MRVFLLLAGLLAVAACSNIPLSPAPKHEFPKTDSKLTAPPQSLLTQPEDP